MAVSRRPMPDGNSPRDRHDRPAGEELGADPDKRTAANVGTRPVPPRPAIGAGKAQRQPTAAGRGRSLRSSPSRGKPGAWPREASGLVASDWNARRSSLNSGAPWPTPEAAAQRVLDIQRKLHKWSTDDQDRRYTDLHNLVYDPATLMVARQRVRTNRGSRSAGVDGQSARHIEHVLGVPRFLGGLREELRSGSFRPLPVKQRRIPKRGGKLRKLGIPTVRDRVVQAALKLVLEPIFEADFQPCSYGFRPGRRAQDAIAEIHFLTSRSYQWVVEADIKACFDELDHTAIAGRVRRRVADKRVIGLVKAFLKAGIMEERGGLEATLTGTPQGGILSP